MGRSLIGSGVLGLALLALGPATSQAALPDATCPGPTNGGETGTEAQTFTAVHTGTLVRGEMFIAKVPGSDFQMQIFAAGPSGPTGPALGTATIPDSSVVSVPSPLPPGPSEPADGTFSPGVPVTAGQMYAIVVTRLGPEFWLTKDRSGNPCPGNEFNLDMDGSWMLKNPTYDYPFSTFVTPPNAFTIGSVNAKRRTVTLTLPGPGAVDITATKLVKSSHTDVAAGGDVVVPVALAKRGKSLLRKKGKLKALLGITFTPTGGEPSAQSAKLKLKGKHKKR